MSLVLAIRKNDRIYLACDTQYSCGDRKMTFFFKENRKIFPLENGMLIGRVGSVHNTERVLAHPEFFTLPKDGTLTKRYVVQKIVPQIFKYYRENDMLDAENEKSPGGTMDESYLLAYGDRMFLIDNMFAVRKVEHYVAIGSGSSLAFAALEALDAADTKDEALIEERLCDAICLAASRIMSVNTSCFLIDTEKQCFKIARQKEE